MVRATVKANQQLMIGEELKEWLRENWIPEMNVELVADLKYLPVKDEIEAAAMCMALRDRLEKEGWHGIAISIETERAGQRPTISHLCEERER